MASIYVANVTGDGLSTATGFRPAGFDGIPFAVLMIDTAVSKKRCVLLSPNDSVTGTGIIKLLTAADLAALRQLASTTSPTTNQRNAINNWLTNAGYPPIPANVTSWLDVLHYVARLVNPVADLAQTSA